MFTCVHYSQLDAQARELSDLDSRLGGLKHVQVEASETAMIAAQLQSQLDISGQQNEELRANNNRLVGMLICTLCVFPSNGACYSTDAGRLCRH